MNIVFYGALHRVGDRHGMSVNLNYLAILVRIAGEFDKAENYFRESLALQRELRNQEGGQVPQ